MCYSTSVSLFVLQLQFELLLPTLNFMYLTSLPKQKYNETNQQQQNNKTQCSCCQPIKVSEGESVVKCTVDQSGPGEYNIKYTPTVRGRHKLTVLVDGQQVEDSSFSVSVSISPTQLGKPLEVWTTGQSDPQDIKLI